METRQNGQSVIAKLMGFGEMPSQQQQQQSVYRQQRVLSESYLQKSGSIGKISSTYRQNHLVVSKKKVNSATNDSNKDVSLKYLEKSSSFDGMQGIESTVVLDSKNNAEKGNSDKGVEKRNHLQSKLKVKAHSSVNIVALKPNLENIIPTSKPSFLINSQTTFAWEVKKQLLERFKMTKVSQEIQSRRRSSTLGEVFCSPKFESKSISESGNPIGIRSNEGWKYESGNEKLPIFRRLNFSSGPTTKFKRMTRSYAKPSSERWSKIMTTNTENYPLDSNSLSPITGSSDANLGTEDVDCSDGDVQDKQKSEPIVCHYSGKEHFLDLSLEQDTPNFMQTDEFLKNMGEGYQPSPDSVLEPPFMEDNSSNTEHCDSVSTNLDGLRMQLELLESESQETHFDFQMVLSSDEEAIERSSSCPGQNMKSMRCVGSKETRDFSYLIDVLEQSVFRGGNTELSFEQWVSSPLVFETLEKKYGKQESWHKSERRLLFDHINAAVTEILRPFIDTHICSKPLRRKMRTFLRRYVVEQELRTLLCNQGKVVNNELSEKAVGKDMWLDLAEEVDSIVSDIEIFLFDELAAELFRF